VEGKGNPFKLTLAGGKEVKVAEDGTFALPDEIMRQLGQVAVSVPLSEALAEAGREQHALLLGQLRYCPLQDVSYVRGKLDMLEEFLLRMEKTLEKARRLVHA